jgi:nitrogen fixation protein NifU and related proteins
MSEQLYREIVLEHWQNPLHSGVIEHADFDVELDNPTCGDRVRATGKITNGVLTDIAFKVSGCAISVAGGSLTSQYIIGKKLSEIKSLDEEKLLADLDLRVTPARTRCALLSFAAIKSYNS